MAADRDVIAFPVLSETQIERLVPLGKEIELRAGEWLWRSGDREFCCFVVREGRVEIRDESGSGQLVAVHESGAFTGDVDLLTGRPAPVGGVAATPVRLLQLGAEEMRELVRIDQDLGAVFVLAFMRRRELLLQVNTYGMQLIGSRFDPHTQAIRTFMGRNRILHRWQTLEDGETGAILTALGLGPESTPLLVTGDRVYVQPTVEQLADCLNLRRSMDQNHYDLVIIGAGPAGLAAAVYGASEGLRTLMVDRSAPGGQASWSSRIENYMGFPEGLTGAELAARGFLQAQKFGAEVSIPDEVVRMECGEPDHALMFASGQMVYARAVLVASGATYQRLDVPGFRDFETRGIYYSATRMEADLCRDSDVVVVGAGNSAGQAAVYLSTQCRRVRLIVRGDRLNKSMSDYLSYRIEQIPNIDVHLQTEVAACEGESNLERVHVRGATQRCFDATGLFIFIGAEPNTHYLPDSIARDANGFVLTGEAVRSYWSLERAPYFLETSCPRVFAAGDCRVGSVKRVAASVGEGSMAVTFTHRVLSA
jgi:thioredoxin reductase (NADPH)